MQITRREGIPRMRIVGHNKKLLWVILALIILLVIVIWAIRASS